MIKWAEKTPVIRSSTEARHLNISNLASASFPSEREYGGGYWLGKTHVDGFECLQRLTSLVITESKMS